jgi:hypothetical protein
MLGGFGVTELLFIAILVVWVYLTYRIWRWIYRGIKGKKSPPDDERIRMAIAYNKGRQDAEDTAK